jgi:UDP-galactopyranose mutase
MKKALILGGGVAGSSASYFLNRKGYAVDIVNSQTNFGGLARTEYYAGHPYEFGPHIWFWPGGTEDPINKVIYELSGGELYYIDRKLFSFIESDNRTYRYPIHFSDISEMPNSDKILKELKSNRDEGLKLKLSNLPEIGKAKFAEYFTAAIGETLYQKFMKDYTHKMWNIAGTNLETSMVWADRFNNEYSKESKEQNWIYDPIKFEDHTLGKGIKFQIYPKLGWNVIWNAMTEDANKLIDTVMEINVKNSNAVIQTKKGREFHTSNYDLIINTLDLDDFFGKETIPYTGRLIIPFLIPNLDRAFSNETESIHYSSAEFITRVTEMKQITRHQSPDTLLLIEIPVLPGIGDFFPENVLSNAKEKNLFAEKAYPQQSKDAIKYHLELTKLSMQIKGWNNVGRHAQFKYWGMPETVKSAFDFTKNL